MKNILSKIIGILSILKGGMIYPVDISDVYLQFRLVYNATRKKVDPQKYRVGGVMLFNNSTTKEGLKCGAVTSISGYSYRNLYAVGWYKWDKGLNQYEVSMTTLCNKHILKYVDSFDKQHVTFSCPEITKYFIFSS